MTTTTATRPRVTRETLEDRWDTLTIGIYRHDAGETNSELWDALDAPIRELAGRMVHGTRGDEEYSALFRLEEDLHAEIQRRIIDFAEGVEAAR